MIRLEDRIISTKDNLEQIIHDTKFELLVLAFKIPDISTAVRLYDIYNTLCDLLPED